MKVEVGAKIGKLTVKKLLHHTKISHSGNTYWYSTAICDCDCGTNDYELNTNNLRKLKERSGCGCNRGKLKVGSGRKPCSYISVGKHFSQQFLNRHKKKAPKRGLRFTLTIADLDAQYEKQNGLCYYTGIPLELPDTTKSYTGNEKNKNVSIDRLDSSLDYTPDNIVLCTYDANLAKQQLSVEAFVRICHQVAIKHPLPPVVKTP